MKCAFAVLVAVFCIGISATDAARVSGSMNGNFAGLSATDLEEAAQSGTEQFLQNGSDMYDAAFDSFVSPVMEEAKAGSEKLRQKGSEILDSEARLGIKTAQKVADKVQKAKSKGLGVGTQVMGDWSF